MSRLLHLTLQRKLLDASVTLAVRPLPACPARRLHQDPSLRPAREQSPQADAAAGARGVEGLALARCHRTGGGRPSPSRRRGPSLSSVRSRRTPMHRAPRCAGQIHSTGRGRSPSPDPTRRAADHRRHLVSRCDIQPAACHGGRCRPHRMRTTPGQGPRPHRRKTPTKPQLQGHDHTPSTSSVQLRTSLPHQTTSQNARASVRLTLRPVRRR